MKITKKEKYLVLYGEAQDEQNVFIAEYTEEEVENLQSDGFGWRDDEISAVIPYDLIEYALKRFNAIHK